MTPLRTKMIKDMKTRRLSSNTQKAYIRAVSGLAGYYKKSPDQLTEKQVQEYLYYLLETRKLSWSTCNIAASAITLERYGTFCHNFISFRCMIDRQS